jgi:RNA polymerase sigma-70 factor (ECF subfamily)
MKMPRNTLILLSFTPSTPFSACVGARAYPAAAARLPPNQPRAYWQPTMPRDTLASDEALMVRYCDGDARAFEDLYARHKGGLYRYLLRQCGQPATAEELFQDVWASLIAARRRYSATARFTTYVYRIAHNRLIDHYRRNQHREMVSYDNEDETGIPEPAAPASLEPHVSYASRERAARLLECIAALPAAQREAFVLQQEAEMSVEEIAEATGVSRETAKSRLRYAIAKLRLALIEVRDD